MSASVKTGRVSRDPEGRMSLGQHLIELRNRGFTAAAGLLAGAIAGWFLQPYVWDGITKPIHRLAESRHVTINFPGLTSAFDLRTQVAIYIGVIIMSPLWLYEIFAFLTPGLTGREKRYVFGFFFTAIPLFLAGCAFGWWISPHIVELFTSFTPKQDANFLTASDYFNFVLKLVIAVGIAFVLPVFIVLLNMIGILKARVILKSWRWAMLAIVLFTAIATPATDVISMFVLALPLVFLYFAAWAFAWFHDRRVARTAYDPEADLANSAS